jgi:hypothetical protein
MIHPRAVIRNQLEAITGLRDHPCINLVAKCGYQNIGLFHRLDKVGPCHRFIAFRQLKVEKFTHPFFDRLWQASRYDNTQACRWHQDPPCALQFKRVTGRVTQERAGHKNPVHIVEHKSDKDHEIRYCRPNGAGAVAANGGGRTGARACHQPAPPTLRVNEGL